MTPRASEGERVGVHERGNADGPAAQASWCPSRLFAKKFTQRVHNLPGPSAAMTITPDGVAVAIAACPRPRPPPPPSVPAVSVSAHAQPSFPAEPPVSPPTLASTTTGSRCPRPRRTPPTCEGSAGGTPLRLHTGDRLEASQAPSSSTRTTAAAFSRESRCHSSLACTARCGGANQFPPRNHEENISNHDPAAALHHERNKRPCPPRQTPFTANKRIRLFSFIPYTPPLPHKRDKRASGSNGINVNAVSGALLRAAPSHSIFTDIHNKRVDKYGISGLSA